MRLLGEYRDEIDELFDAAGSLRQRSVEEGPELFWSQLDDELWTDEWHVRNNPGKWGCLFREGWYLDDDTLEPTSDHAQTQGPTGFRLHYVHLIRNERSFIEGELTHRLRCPTNVRIRNELHRLYNSEPWQEKLRPMLKERGITNKGNKRDLMQKTYDIDQSGLPESYFKTLATAFEEHLPIATVIDEIVAEAPSNIQDT